MLWLQQKSPGRPTRIDKPFRITITLYPPDKRKRDDDNCMKILMDFLQRIEIIKDDSLSRERHVYWGEVRKGASCCVVELEELPDIGLARSHESVAK